MEAEQVGIAQPEMGDHHPAACAVGRAAARSQPDAEVDWQVLSVLVITLGLLGYGCYLAWESWGKLLQLMAGPVSMDVAIIAMTIQVVAPLLPALSYMLIHLSRRRNAPWFLSAGALCLLGLVTGAIEVFVHAIG